MMLRSPYSRCKRACATGSSSARLCKIRINRIEISLIITWTLPSCKCLRARRSGERRLLDDVGLPLQLSAAPIGCHVFSGLHAGSLGRIASAGESVCIGPVFFFNADTPSHDTDPSARMATAQPAGWCIVPVTCCLRRCAVPAAACPRPCQQQGAAIQSAAWQTRGQKAGQSSSQRTHSRRADAAETALDCCRR